ncbi:FAD-dependent oxidoreductase [Saccharopolyspora erythraea]|uniref:hydroxysqualene dehydroxylase HpnE n=1 Tax=Saccharopolyspora erythraea TaxID=1836 RepID=UPI001BA9C90C|nr:hydroxysqualene dehydroxylase HpnE [Saccharopolyspora erythraea]QUH02338.1 FAD-dependent oxidoreductase [Saccharopolyspora erythraea]
MIGTGGGKIVVVGAGLAGITAALDCADRGHDVTLLEGRPRLGGATSSFQRQDLVVDTGQHVFLRCYSEYAALLDRMGVADGVEVQPRFRVPVLAPLRRGSVLRRWNLPAPAHLAPVLFGHRMLTLPERIRVARTAMGLRALDVDDPELDRSSLGDWLRDRGETERSVRLLWGLLAVAALNAQPDDASMALAAVVFRRGLLDGASNGDIGFYRRPLGELHGQAAGEALTAAGVDVRLRSTVSAVRRGGERWSVAVRNGGEIGADSVVVAVPHRRAASLLSGLGMAEAARWERLSASPIVNVHVVYDRPVTDLDMAAVVDSPVQFVFDRSRAAGVRRGQYLAISLSAADDCLDTRTADLREEFLPALGDLFPRARDARVLDFFVSREPNATFRQAPGTAELRPPARTGLPGLVLAGAWTATGWPDTTEGAVRSGRRAAEAVDADLRRARHDLEVTA